MSCGVLRMITGCGMSRMRPVIASST
jgi:hypothetical protein